MGALRIECYCNERQMTKLIDHIVEHLNISDVSDMSDIDEVMGDIRLCVDFETYMDKVTVKAVEVLDSDWDLLYEDTAVLTSRLKPIMNYFNQNNAEIHLLATEYRRDQLIGY